MLSAPAARSGDAAAATSAMPHGRRRRCAAVAVAVVLASLALVASRIWPQPAAAVTTPATVRSVAVMPFVDLSPARDHEYFGDGIAEELSTRLARVPGLKVAARTSAFSFKARPAPTRRRSAGR